MSNVLNIVRLRAKDAERFLNLRLQALGSDPLAYRFNAQDDADIGLVAWRARLEREYVVVAEVEKDWLAVGGIARYSGKLLTHKALLWGMYAVPQARGSGAADAIMHAMLGFSAKHVRQVQLTVMSDNARAIRFYERHGFETYAVEPQAVRRGETLADETLMWKRVGGEA